MYIKFIEKGTILDIFEEGKNHERGGKYKAIFYELYSEKQFFVQSAELYQNYRNINQDTCLRISFLRGAHLYTFTGKAKRVLRDGEAYLTIIEQQSAIETTSRRKYQREEMRLYVSIYGLEAECMDDTEFHTFRREVEFSSETFDISAGGLCLVSNEYLESAYEPNFLLEFVLNGKDKFLLPAKLVRKGNCPQTSLYRYDYGFEFYCDNIPNEKKRLTAAMLAQKLAKFR